MYNFYRYLICQFLLWKGKWLDATVMHINFKSANDEPNQQLMIESIVIKMPGPSSSRNVAFQGRGVRRGERCESEQPSTLLFITAQKSFHMRNYIKYSSCMTHFQFVSFTLYETRLLNNCFRIHRTQWLFLIKLV